MAFITLVEIFDMLMTIAFVGYIFSDVFPKRPKHVFKTDEGDLVSYQVGGFDWEGFKFAAIVAGSAIVLHELAHKIVAMSMGMTATYEAAYLWLIIGLVLKLAGVRFIFLVPAFVAIFGRGTALQFSAIAFAGPAMNGLLWLSLWIAQKRKMIPKKYLPFAHFGAEINKLLFIFNLIPIPGFDGFKVAEGIFKTFF